MSGHLRVGDPRSRALPLARARVHQIVDMQYELSCRARDTFAMRYMIKGPSQLAMIGDESPDVVKTLARGLKYSFELGFGLRLGFAEGHLHAAVRVHFAFA